MFLIYSVYKFVLHVHLFIWGAHCGGEGRVHHSAGVEVPGQPAGGVSSFLPPYEP